MRRQGLCRVSRSLDICVSWAYGLKDYRSYQLAKRRGYPNHHTFISLGVKFPDSLITMATPVQTRHLAETFRWVDTQYASVAHSVSSHVPAPTAVIAEDAVVTRMPAKKVNIHCKVLL